MVWILRSSLTRKCWPRQCPWTASVSFAPASVGSSRWRSDMDKQAKNTICLWYDGDAENAARFYAKTFPDSSVGASHRAPGDFPSGKKGDVLTVEFTVMGIPCIGLHGGPEFKHNEAFSFQVATADQAETDRYWNAIIGNGGQASMCGWCEDKWGVGRPSMCGWCKDKWGVSWQITPSALTKAITDPDPAAAKRAFEAMMHMEKIDVAAMEAARRGWGARNEKGSGAMSEVSVRYMIDNDPETTQFYTTHLSF